MNLFLKMGKARMTFKLILGFIIFMCTTFTIKAQELKYKTFKLKNGMDVILCEDHSLPDVFGMVAVKAGAKNDPKGATGMAHYQEHMLFKGTTELGTSNWEKEKVHIDRIFKLYDELGATKDPEQRKEIQKKINKESLEAGKYSILNETSSMVKQMGGTNMNAGTGWDQTVYYNSFPPNQMEKWIDLYSHRFIDPVFRSFQAELEVVYEEKNMYDDNFITPLINAFNAQVYKNHPYGQQTIIGTTDDLKNPSLTKMYDFFKTYYVANNMVLVMVGDFDIDTAIPMIEEKFGRLPNKEIPQFETPKEKSFDGREFVEGRFSPIRLILLGFKSVPVGHPDELALNAFNSLLSNGSNTGVLNKITMNGDVMGAEIMPMRMGDYGTEIALVVPKIIGQKMEVAENIVLDAIKKVRDGEFSEEDLDAIKKKKYREYLLEMESNESIAYTFMNAYMCGESYEDALNRAQKIQELTKEDLMRVAKKYYGDNYLAFYSKMGFPKKDKLEKPGYDPVTTNTTEESKYAKHFKSIPSKTLEPIFVDFQNDVARVDVQPGVKLYHVNNEQNEVFDISFRFGVGSKDLKEAEMVSNLLEFAGGENLSPEEYRKAFAKIGCSYSINTSGSFVTFSITGLEDGFDESLQLMSKLMDKPVIKPNSYGVVRQAVKMNRKLEREELASVGEALYRYVSAGDKSPFLNRMTKKEIKKFGQEQFNDVFAQIKKYSVNIHYAGKKNPEQVKELVAKNIHFAKQPIESSLPNVIDPTTYTENTIFFVKKKKAVQASIYYLMNGDVFDKKDDPAMAAFNLYFGGGFSGLVLQEIREYRSMAYSAYADYRHPHIAGKKNSMLGYVGTQADKSIEAIKIFNGLLEDMPQKPERIEFMKPFIAQVAATLKPDFRELSRYVENKEWLGYDYDPAKDLYKFAKDMSFEDIVDFYKRNVKDRPFVIAIVGDPKRIDLKKLAEFGKVVKIKEKALFSK
ncbi:MAG: M16 family metallopeptidase [Bacteroidales bacterium]